MKIILDLRSIVQPESGDGQFAINLINSLADIDESNSYILLAQRQMQPYFRMKNPNFKIMASAIKPYSVLEQLALPGLVGREKAGLFHSFTSSMPYWINCPAIITIYDLIHLHFKNNYPYTLQFYYQTVVKGCMKKAERILTISNHSKSDIISNTGVDKDKVKVIYCGLNSRFSYRDKASSKSPLENKFNPHDKFLLYVGNMRPHKNVSGLIDIFKRCQEKRSGLILAICGKKKFSYKKIEQKVRRLGLEDKVRFMDSVSDEALPLLYNAADLFVYPSLYEGFGLPPLEAMSCGVPVVSSNAASLPEILGDAARFADPHDIEGFSEAIIEILSDAQAAESLSRKGLERSRLFSWEKSARELLDLYKDTMGA